MSDKPRFYINNTKSVNGASIFGLRLKEALMESGWRWDLLLPSISFIFSSGIFRPFSKNILRLDGLYFDIKNTLGDSDKKNKPILNAYKKADGIIFQSEFDRKLFSSFVGPSKCTNSVIFNGAPAVFSLDGPGIDYGFNKSLLCSADWRSHKRLNCIVQGFLEYGDPDTCLVILGDNADEIIDHPNIRKPGKIHPAKLPYYIRGADAFIHLSWIDHCPNAVVEALCCGLPVLCSHNGGTKELVRDNGIIIECEEDYDFKKVNLYDPPKCDKRIVADGIEKILRWEKQVDASYLQINNVASRYADFGCSILYDRK